MNDTMENQETIKLFDDEKVSNLRAEYEANIQLSICEATFREQHSQIFLTINTILLVALGILATFSPSHLDTALSALSTSLFASATCIIYCRILRKNGAYMQFRRFQLRAIEAKLQNVTTFQNSWKSLNEYGELKVPELEETFQVDKSSRHSTITLQNSLPLIFTIFWVAIFMVAFGFILIQLL